MLQAANSDLFNPLVPKAVKITIVSVKNPISCTDYTIKCQFKVNLAEFSFLHPGLGTNGFKFNLLSDFTFKLDRYQLTDSILNAKQLFHFKKI